MSSLKEYEGFKATPWYQSQYFLIPMASAIFLIGPLLYLLYILILKPINKTLNAT